MTDSSTQGIKTVLHPVSDLAKAKPVYAALLGVAPQADAAYYVGFEAAGQHIGLVPGGAAQATACPSLWPCSSCLHPLGGARVTARLMGPEAARGRCHRGR